MQLIVKEIFCITTGYIKLMIICMFTSIFKPFHVQFRTVGDEILRSRLFRAIVQLADVFAHQVINALAPDVIVARL